VAGALVLLAFLTTGGTDLAPNTWVQISLLVVGAALAAYAAALGVRPRRWGGVTILLFAGLVLLTYASIAWSVQPANSWLEANRTLSYFATFIAAVAAARAVPRRWPALPAAIAMFATIVCAWALLGKVFPGWLDPSAQVGRLRAPFDYDNATGLAAALGIPACVWAGARREGGLVLRALAMPSLSILIVALILSESRGGIAAAVVGVGLWIALVPLRLRAALVLAVGGVGGAAASLWAVAHTAITHDGAPLAVRISAGHQFGVVLLVTLVTITGMAFATALAMERLIVAPHLQRRIGVGLLVALSFVPVGVLVALATSSRGLTGEVSHAWSSLTNPNSVVHETPGRLAELSSSRARYWREGLRVGEHALLAGTGALGFATARTRYNSDPLPVKHAHSYLVETFADFGLLGVALTLALLAAWLLAVRQIGLLRARAPGHAAERGGLCVVLAVTVTFGVQSLLDWTWFVPGVAVPALLCAGWLAGRAALTEPVWVAPRRPRLLDAPGRAALIFAIAALSALGAWIVWEPQRSVNADSAAISAMERGDTATALADARTAATSNPVSIDPLVELSAIYEGLGNQTAAHDQLIDATRRQPSNPTAWEWRAQFDVRHHLTDDAVRSLRSALRLDPYSAPDRALLMRVTTSASGQA
jgi:hypothetical protein